MTLHPNIRQLDEIKKILRNVSKRYRISSPINNQSMSNMLVNIEYVDEDGNVCTSIWIESLWIESKRFLEDLVNNIKLELMLAGIDLRIDLRIDYYGLKDNESEILSLSSTIELRENMKGSGSDEHRR